VNDGGARSVKKKGSWDGIPMVKSEEDIYNESF